MFGQTLEALYLRGLKGKLSPEHVAGLRSRGLDVEQPLRPAYARAVVVACVEFSARTLFPALPAETAHYQLGKFVTPGQRTTLLGNAILTVAGLLGPHRALERIARTFRSTNNDMAVTLTRLGDTDYALVLEPSNDYPSYMQAVIEDILTVARARELQVVVEAHDRATARCTYRITWQR